MYSLKPDILSCITNESNIISLGVVHVKESVGMFLISEFLTLYCVNTINPIKGAISDEIVMFFIH